MMAPQRALPALRALPAAIVGVVLLTLWQWWVTAFDIPAFSGAESAAGGADAGERLAGTDGALLVTLKVTFLSFTLRFVLTAWSSRSPSCRAAGSRPRFPYAVLLPGHADRGVSRR